MWKRALSSPWHQGYCLTLLMGLHLPQFPFLRKFRHLPQWSHFLLPILRHHITLPARGPSDTTIAANKLPSLAAAVWSAWYRLQRAPRSFPMELAATLERQVLVSIRPCVIPTVESSSFKTNASMPHARYAIQIRMFIPPLPTCLVFATIMIARSSNLGSCKARAQHFLATQHHSPTRIPSDCPLLIGDPFHERYKPAELLRILSFTSM